ncbi:cell cycle checkpoint [Irpex rosettiformis]|uniref:Cell cycle checkpoint n=1 Tax=Irpex rosettiformis TaxID=378272 RepID=A0ACB8U7M2_9APHY|nr:cell cycle checkpoint [Irpex rosettiformis]
MRFRAGIESVDTFYKIIQAVEKLQKRCVIKFTETDLHIICANDVNEGGIQVWSQIKIPSLFNDLRIQSNANNQISMLLSPEALLSALRSAANPSTASTSNAVLHQVEAVMRLAKKNDQAVLSFEINGLSRNAGRYVRVNHDVRIEIMKPQDVQRLSEPMCPEPDVHVLLPQLTKLRAVVERLRSLSDTVAIRANRSGRLEFSVRTDSVSTDVAWTGLSNPTMAKEGGSQEPSQISQPHDPEEMFGVLISVKSFLQFLNSHVVSTTTIACICQNHCMILYVYIGEVADAGGVLTYYIPAMVDDTS